MSAARSGTCWRSTRPSPPSSPSPTSTPASTIRRSSATSPRSSRDSTAWRPMLMSPVSAPTGSFVRSGKVRDLYAIGDDRLLLVASDRISAFDVILPTEIPDKGRVLTGLSRHWFATTGHIVPNHLLSTETKDPALRGRIMICRPTTVIPIEAVVRGYLAGSGWKEYRVSGRVCGVGLAPGLVESDRLPEPIFTPATKAEAGDHDENIDFDTMAATVGGDVAERVRELSLA